MDRARKIYLLRRTNSGCSPWSLPPGAHVPVCSPPESGRNHDLFQVSSVWQRQQASTWLHTYDYISTTDSSLRRRILRRISPLLALKKPAARLWTTYGASHLTENWGQPLANSQQETETLSPAACKEWKTNQSLGADVSTALTDILIEPLWVPKAEHLAKPHPTHRSVK